jgi:NTP pyrophosphatase (non-canonical NTP hydrolase)
MSDISKLQQRAMKVRQLYSQLNSKDGHDQWSGKEYAMGFVGDVGDLLKLVMAKENLRHMDDLDTKLAHELADCLWSVLVLSTYYEVDIEKEFMKTMEQLEARISEGLS